MFRANVRGTPIDAINENVKDELDEGIDEPSTIVGKTTQTTQTRQEPTKCIAQIADDDALMMRAHISSTAAAFREYVELVPPYVRMYNLKLTKRELVASIIFLYVASYGKSRKHLYEKGIFVQVAVMLRKGRDDNILFKDADNLAKTVVVNGWNELYEGGTIFEDISDVAGFFVAIVSLEICRKRIAERRLML